MGDVHLGARAHEDQLGGSALRVAQHVGPALDRVVGHRGGVPHRQALARQREHRRPVGCPCGVAPREGGLVEAGGPDDVEVGRRPQRHELLDRLVRRAVLPHADRVVREDERGRDVHDRGQPDRALHVVREDQEAGAVGAEARQREAVDDRAHRVLANAEVQVAPAVVPGLDAVGALDQRQRRGREVGGSADEVGQPGRDPLQHLLPRLAGGDHAGVGPLLRRVGAEAVGQAVGEEALEFGRLDGEVRAEGGERLVPLRLLLTPALDRAAEVLQRLLGNEEGLEAGIAVDLLGQPDLLLAERRSVRAVGVLLVRRAGRDVRADDDQAGAVLDLLGDAQRLLQAVEPDVLVEVLHVPAVGLVAGADVLGEGELRVALDRDVVVVVEPDQPAEPEMAGDRGRLGGDPLLHVAVRSDEVGEVVDGLVVAEVEAGGQHALAERHPDRRGDPLPERPGGRLHARHVPVLRVARARRVELAEALDLVERDVVARQVQRRVQEHRGVAARQDEAVATGPVRIGGRVPHHAGVEEVGDRRQRHRRAGMAGVGRLDGVHGQGADRVHAQLVQRTLVRSHRHVAPSPRLRARDATDSRGMRPRARSRVGRGLTDRF